MPRIWYSIERDGECSLSNPKVWDKMLLYVKQRVYITKHILYKDFTEPIDVLVATQEKIQSLIGAQSYDFIFLRKKINIVLQQQWIEYIKAFRPELWRKTVWYQRMYYAANREELRNQRNGSKSAKVHNQKQQTKLRESVSEHYVLNVLYNKLKRGGTKYTMQEIRDKFPREIKETRASIISSRVAKKVRNKLDTLCGKKVGYGLSEFTIVKYSCKPNCGEVKIWVDDRDEPFVRKPESALELIETMRLINAD